MNSRDHTNYDPFPAARWSLVAAARSDDEGKARRAIGVLCETYLFPNYSDIRNQGHEPYDAEDFKQSFFQLILQRNSLVGTEESRGKWRSDLLASVKKFLIAAPRKESSPRRGGKTQTGPIDFSSAETMYAVSSQTGRATSEATGNFEREGANIIIFRVLGNWPMGISEPRMEALFGALGPYPTGMTGDPPCREFGETFSMKAATMRVPMMRMLSSRSRSTSSITKWAKSSSGPRFCRSGGNSIGVSRFTDTKRALMD
ncbi:MAG: hypothetical protein ABGZ49_11600 [Akkermansiaceae bacterium]